LSLFFCSSCSRPIDRDNQSDYEGLGLGDLCGKCAEEIISGIGGDVDALG